MIPNRSPWLHQLQRDRPVIGIKNDVRTDVVIIGGGIAGISSAYFTLRDTNKSVVLLEADKVAHGATGHNAGQITSYFERPFSEIVDEFGLTQAIAGQRAIESTWILIDEIIAEAKLQTPLYRFTGYTGLSNLEQVLAELKNNHCRRQGGLAVEAIALAAEWEHATNLPTIYKDLYTVIAQKDLLELIETNNTDYIASISTQKGCMNSAMFSEEVLQYLQTTYKNRFTFFEGSPVKTINLQPQHAKLEVQQYTVDANFVILCTNGFENFSIRNHGGTEIDTSFHHSVAGRIGYMSGYIEPLNHAPVAISYFPKNNKLSLDPTGESYFYLTRRPHEHLGKNSYNLVCTGGPEKQLPNGANYTREDSCSEEFRTSIDDFLRSNYNKHPKTETEYSFCWHGLMGYTPNRIRRIGPEPCNPVLLYNLGCNGVGILPSIYGGQRIAQILRGDQLEPSIFDPVDQRCQR